MGDDTAASQASQGSPGPLVLIVDDNQDTLAICARTLEAAGYRTATATSGDDALARLAALRPALVVLDLAMPGRDGFTTAQAMRERPDVARTPILVFTGLSPTLENAARRAGGTAFCTKPLEPRRLLAEVRRLCPLR